MKQPICPLAACLFYPIRDERGKSKTHRSTEKRGVLRDSLGSSRCVKDTQQLFQVVLHESVEEDLVLVSKRRKEGMLEDDGGLLLLDGLLESTELISVLSPLCSSPRRCPLL